MFKFIKNLLGFGAKESVKEIVTPPAPYKLEAPTEPVLITRVAVPESNPSVIATPVAKPAVKEGKARANVKKPNPNAKRPPAPPRPTPKAKSKPKAKRK